jgi:hypothetical protein
MVVLSPQTILMAQWDLVECRRYFCPPPDVAGKMKFDLNGAANYNHYENQTATPTKGSFVLDVKNQKLIITKSKY